MATVTHPVSADIREDSRGRVTHPLERLRGYIRLYVAAEGIAVLLLSLALVFWLGLLVDYGVFKAFGLDWVQELGYVGRTLLLGFLFTLTLAGIQLFRLFKFLVSFLESPEIEKIFTKRQASVNRAWVKPNGLLKFHLGFVKFPIVLKSDVGEGGVCFRQSGIKF